MQGYLNWKKIYDIAQKLVLRVLEMEPGDRTTVVRLVHEIEPSLIEDDPGDTMFADPMYDMTEALFDLSRNEGDLLLDMSEHDGKEEGLPFNLDFIVRKRTGCRHLDVDARMGKLEWFYFMIGSCLEGHSEVTFRKDDADTWWLVEDQEEVYLVGCTKVSDQDIQALKRLIKDTGVLKWGSDYWGPILDGAQWSCSCGLAMGRTSRALEAIAILLGSTRSLKGWLTWDWGSKLLTMNLSS